VAVGVQQRDVYRHKASLGAARKPAAIGRPRNFLAPRGHLLRDSISPDEQEPVAAEGERFSARAPRRAEIVVTWIDQPITRSIRSDDVKAVGGDIGEPLRVARPGGIWPVGAGDAIDEPTAGRQFDDRLADGAQPDSARALFWVAVERRTGHPEEQVSPVRRRHRVSHAAGDDRDVAGWPD
jgi:hypothetical protein